MSRLVDMAADLEARERDDAIARHRQRPVDEGGDGCCVDCDEPIDPRRLAAVPTAIRCAQHQNEYEKRQRQFRGR